MGKCVHAWRRGFACKGTARGIVDLRNIAARRIVRSRFAIFGEEETSGNGFVQEEEDRCRIFCDSKKGGKQGSDISTGT